MLDFIPKGTGNSRILKSVSNFASLYPTYADFIAALAVAGIPIDLAGVNSAGYNQLGTPLNVANLLSPEAVAALKIKTLDPTVNDAFLTIANQWASRNDFAKALVLSIADGLNDSNVPDMVCNRVLDRLATNDNVSGDWNYSSGKISVSASGNSAYYFDVYNVITTVSYTEDPNWTGGFPRQETDSGSLTIIGATTYSFNSNTGKYIVSFNPYVDKSTINAGDPEEHDYVRYDISNGGDTLIEYHLYNNVSAEVFIDTRTKSSISGTPTYSKGSYIETITAGQNDYPANGKQGDRWYVRGSQVPGVSTATAELGPFSLSENCDRAVPYFAETKSGNVSVSYQASFNNGTDWSDAKNGKMVVGQAGDQLLLRAIAKFEAELHDPSTDEIGKVVDTDGTIITAAAYTATDWIPISGNTLTVKTSGTAAGTLRLRVALYNASKTFISPIAVNRTYYSSDLPTINTITLTGTNAAYARVGFITGLDLSVQTDSTVGSVDINGYGCACMEVDE